MARKQSLARNLAINFSLFVLLGSLAFAVWMTWRHQHQSLIGLKKLAATNASFIEELRLPKSRESAEKFSRILDVGVGFYFANGDSGDWPPQLSDSIKKLAAEKEPAATRTHDFAIAIAPFPDGDASLILIRKTTLPFPVLASVILVPALLFTVACAILAALLGGSIVKPLSTLAEWLPNLNPKPDKDLEPLPFAITSRRDEIGMLARALEQTTHNLRQEQQLRRQSERLATLGRIATSLAHEIRNPAAAIGLHTDLLAESAGGTNAESIELIREEVDRITDLVNQWLFVARSAPTRKEAHDLRDLLDNVSRRLRPILEHARASLSVKAPKSAPIPVQVDAPRIEQVLRNLLLNAAQAMPAGGEIRASLQTDQESAILTIEDDGRGFSKEALEHFGEAFFSEREGGMGIGLTLACDVVQAHGGSLIPEKAANLRGACLVLTLPLFINFNNKS